MEREREKKKLYKSYTVIENTSSVRLELDKNLNEREKREWDNLQ